MKYPALTLISLLLIVLACNMPTPQTAVTPASTSTLPATEISRSTEIPPTIDTTAVALSQTARAPAPSPTVSPSESPTLQPPRHGALLYETQFTQGWPPLTGDKANGKSVSGGFQIDITQPWALYAYTTRARQSTFFAEITATPLQCPAGSGGYGMIFHYQSDTSYRFATIWCSGRYSLSERTGSTSAVTLGEGSLPQEIHPSTGEHTVSVGAVGNKLTLFVDGRQITQVDVTTMPTGDIGPYAETTGDPLSVLFTRLSVYAAG